MQKLKERERNVDDGHVPYQPSSRQLASCFFQTEQLSAVYKWRFTLL